MAAKITNYINLSISLAGRGITAESVDRVMLFGYHTKWPEYTRQYASIAGLISDGFSATDPVALMATALQAQNPRVSSFLVGRRATPMTQDIDLTLTGSEGDTVAVTIAKAGVSLDYSYTITGAGVPAAATALAAAINADTEGWGTSGDATLTVGAVGSVVSLTSTVPGSLWYYSDLAYISYEDVTADPGIADDLADLLVADSNWYAVALDSTSAAEQAALAAALSAEEKLFVAASQDTTNLTGTGLLADLKDENYTRTAGIYSSTPAQYHACRYLGSGITFPPGSITWMYLDLAGATAEDLTEAQFAQLKTDYANVFAAVQNVGGITQWGTTASGKYIDEVHLKDYLTFRIREEIFALLRGSKKVPYTDKAALAVKGAILRVLKTAAANGGLSLVDENGQSTFSFSFLPAADQLAADKAARIFRGIEWTAVLTGASHVFYLTGNLVEPS